MLITVSIIDSSLILRIEFADMIGDWRSGEMSKGKDTKVFEQVLKM